MNNSTISCQHQVEMYLTHVGNGPNNQHLNETDGENCIVYYESENTMSLICAALSKYLQYNNDLETCYLYKATKLKRSIVCAKTAWRLE